MKKILFIGLVVMFLLNATARAEVLNREIYKKDNLVDVHIILLDFEGNPLLLSDVDYHPVLFIHDFMTDGQYTITPSSPVVTVYCRYCPTQGSVNAYRIKLKPFQTYRASFFAKTIVNNTTLLESYRTVKTFTPRKDGHQVILRIPRKVSVNVTFTVKSFYYEDNQYTEDTIDPQDGNFTACNYEFRITSEADNNVIVRKPVPSQNPFSITLPTGRYTVELVYGGGKRSPTCYYDQFRRSMWLGPDKTSSPPTYSIQKDIKIKWVDRAYINVAFTRPLQDEVSITIFAHDRVLYYKMNPGEQSKTFQTIVGWNHIKFLFGCGSEYSRTVYIKNYDETKKITLYEDNCLYKRKAVKVDCSDPSQVQNATAKNLKPVCRRTIEVCSTNEETVKIYSLSDLIVFGAQGETFPTPVFSGKVQGCQTIEVEEGIYKLFKIRTNTELFTESSVTNFNLARSLRDTTGQLIFLTGSNYHQRIDLNSSEDYSLITLEIYEKPVRYGSTPKAVNARVVVSDFHTGKIIKEIFGGPYSITVPKYREYSIVVSADGYVPETVKVKATRDVHNLKLYMKRPQELVAAKFKVLFPNLNCTDSSNGFTCQDRNGNPVYFDFSEVKVKKGYFTGSETVNSTEILNLAQEEKTVAVQESDLINTTPVITFYEDIPINKTTYIEVNVGIRTDKILFYSRARTKVKVSDTGAVQNFLIYDPETHQYVNGQYSSQSEPEFTITSNLSLTAHKLLTMSRTGSRWNREFKAVIFNSMCANISEMKVLNTIVSNDIIILPDNCRIMVGARITDADINQFKFYESRRGEDIPTGDQDLSYSAQYDPTTNDYHFTYDNTPRITHAQSDWVYKTFRTPVPLKNPRYKYPAIFYGYRKEYTHNGYLLLTVAYVTPYKNEDQGLLQSNGIQHNDRFIRAKIYIKKNNEIYEVIEFTRNDADYTVRMQTDPGYSFIAPAVPLVDNNSTMGESIYEGIKFEYLYFNRLIPLRSCGTYNIEGYFILRGQNASGFYKKLTPVQATVDCTTKFGFRTIMVLDHKQSPDQSLQIQNAILSDEFSVWPNVYNSPYQDSTADRFFGKTSAPVFFDIDKWKPVTTTKNIRICTAPFGLNGKGCNQINDPNVIDMTDKVDELKKPVIEKILVFNIRNANGTETFPLYQRIPGNPHDTFINSYIQIFKQPSTVFNPANFISEFKLYSKSIQSSYTFRFPVVIDNDTNTLHAKVYLARPCPSANMSPYNDDMKRKYYKEIVKDIPVDPNGPKEILVDIPVNPFGGCINTFTTDYLLKIQVKTDKPEGFRKADGSFKKVFIRVNPHSLPTGRLITQDTKADALAYWGGYKYELEVDPNNPQQTKPFYLKYNPFQFGRYTSEIEIVAYTDDLNETTMLSYISMWTAAGTQAINYVLDKLFDKHLDSIDMTGKHTYKYVKKYLLSNETEIVINLPYITTDHSDYVIRHVIVNVNSDKGFYPNMIDMLTLVTMSKLFSSAAEAILTKAASVNKTMKTIIKDIQAGKNFTSPTYYLLDGTVTTDYSLAQGAKHFTVVNNGGNIIISSSLGLMLSTDEFINLYNKWISLGKNLKKASFFTSFVRSLEMQPITKLLLKTVTAGNKFMEWTLEHIHGVKPQEVIKTTNLVAMLLPFGGLPPSGMPVVTVSSAYESLSAVPNCEGCSDAFQIKNWITNYFNKPLKAQTLEFWIKTKPKRTIKITASAQGHDPYVGFFSTDSDPIVVNITMHRKEGAWALSSVENFFQAYPLMAEMLEELTFSPEIYPMTSEKGSLIDYMAEGIGTLLESVAVDVSPLGARPVETLSNVCGPNYYYDPYDDVYYDDSTGNPCVPALTENASVSNPNNSCDRVCDGTFNQDFFPDSNSPCGYSDSLGYCSPPCPVCNDDPGWNYSWNTRCGGYEWWPTDDWCTPPY